MAPSIEEDSFNHSKSMSSAGRPGFGISVLHEYQGFWIDASPLETIKDFQNNFKALDNDLILASIPKSGTNWLKALTFAIVNRTRYPILSSSKTHHQHPLLTTSPRELVPIADFGFFPKDPSLLGYTETSSQNSPCRLVATHLPYSSLPVSVTDSSCKVLYICRNPHDTFISFWHFINKIRINRKITPMSIEDAFKYFCHGVSSYGPFWDHLLGYWKESLKNPHKVLFLKYEDLKKEPEAQLKKLAEFLGYGFSIEEESQGMIKEIVNFCSFQHLMNLDVNKNEKVGFNFLANKDFFRKGEVGDWKNYMTPSMVEQLDRLMEEKLHGSGLTFEKCIP